VAGTLEELFPVRDEVVICPVSSKLMSPNTRLQHRVATSTEPVGTPSKIDGWSI
jgi:hypothetical protein